MQVLFFRLKNFVAEDNRFGYRASWSEMPAAMLLIASYLRRKGFNVIISDHEVGNGLSVDDVDVVVGVIPLCDGLPHGLVHLKEAKEKGKVTVLALYDDWDTVQRDILNDFPFVDYAIRRADRELALEALLKTLNSGGTFKESTPGLIFRQNGEVVDGGTLYAMNNLNHLKSCTREMKELDPSKYNVFFIRAIIGCPFSCTYCYLAKTRIRYRNPDAVAEEMALVPANCRVRLGSTDMLLDRRWAEEFLQELVTKGSVCNYDMDVRADSVIRNADLLPLFKKTGCIELVMGGESFHPEVLKATCKDISVDQYLKAVDIAIEAGIRPSFTMMLGHPLDSRETLEETYRRIKDLSSEVEINGFQYLRPLPGTQVEKECLDKGLLKAPLTYKDFIYARNHPLMPTLYLTEEELAEWFKKFSRLLAKRSFSNGSRPKIIGYARQALPLMLNKMGSFKSMIKKLSTHKRLNDQIVSLSPNNILLYRYILNLYKKDPRIIFLKPGRLYTSSYPNKIVLSLRHDVNVTPKSLKLLTDIEDELGLRSMIYVIVDENCYSLVEHTAYFKDLAEKGFVIGLYTTAQRAKVPLPQFAEEREKFKKILGYYPQFFSIHGISPHPEDWEEHIADFLKEVKLHLKWWGLYPCTQELEGIRHVEDSGEGGELGYLKGDFFNILDFPLGTKVELITHPEHWAEHLVPLKVDEEKKV